MHSIARILTCSKWEREPSRHVKSKKKRSEKEDSAFQACLCAQSLSCVWLFDPMDCSPPGSSAHGILQTRILEWVAIFSSRESSWPREPLHWQVVSLLLSHLGFKLLTLKPGALCQEISIFLLFDYRQNSQRTSFVETNSIEQIIAEPHQVNGMWIGSLPTDLLFIFPSRSVRQALGGP